MSPQVTVYHNPRCSKSRAAVAVLEESSQEYNIVKYLDTPLTQHQIEKLFHILEDEPIDLVRTKDASFKETGVSKESLDSHEKIAEFLATHPQCMERPVVVKGNRALIARPTERLQDIL